MIARQDTATELFIQWTTLLTPFAVPADRARMVFQHLATAYAAADRYYHNLTHIGQVLRVIERLREYTDNLPAVQLAAWFHDVVYDTQAADNEEQSAVYARRMLAELGLPGDLVQRVSALLLATKDHRAPDADSAVLLDADLAILGTVPEEYRHYAQAIRQEYAWVPEAAYRAGRAAVLRAFLERERIYQTEPMFGVYEVPARRNLRAELAALSGDGRWTMDDRR